MHYGGGCGYIGSGWGGSFNRWLSAFEEPLGTLSERDLYKCSKTIRKKV